RIRELVGTNREVHCGSKQGQLSYRDRSDRIATTGSGSNRIRKRTCSSKHMSLERIGELVGTNSEVHCGRQQWQLSYRDRSDRIATNTGNGIGDHTCRREAMPVKRIRELVGTNREVHCGSQQWQLSYRDRSDRIATTGSGSNRINK